jgi:hypothetical protein
MLHQPSLLLQPSAESKKLFEKTAPLAEKANKIYLHIIKQWYMFTEEEKLKPNRQADHKKQIATLAKEKDLRLLVLEEVLKEPDSEFFKKIINGINTDEQGLASLMQPIEPEDYGFFYEDNSFNDSLNSLFSVRYKNHRITPTLAI